MALFHATSMNVASSFSKKRTVQRSYDAQLLISLDFHLRQQKLNLFKQILHQMRIPSYLTDSFRALVMAKEWHLIG